MLILIFGIGIHRKIVSYKELTHPPTTLKGACKEGSDKINRSPEIPENCSRRQNMYKEPLSLSLNWSSTQYYPASAKPVSGIGSCDTFMIYDIIYTPRVNPTMLFLHLLHQCLSEFLFETCNFIECLFGLLAPLSDLCFLFGMDRVLVHQ